MTRPLRILAVAVAFLGAACATPNFDEEEGLPPGNGELPSSLPQDDDEPLSPVEAGVLPLPSSSAPAPPQPAATCALPAPAPAAELTSRWSVTAPAAKTGVVPSVRSRVILADCTMVVAALMLPIEPDNAWTVYLHKTDTTPGSCKEPKGYATLVAKTYAVPVVRVASHPADPKLFVVAYSKKTTATGTLVHDMDQIDWGTGAALHMSSPYVKGKPQSFPQPASRPSAVAINGCDVTLTGRGSFSGATGTPTDEWVATYPHFIAPQRQPPSGATLAAYQ